MWLRKCARKENYIETLVWTELFLNIRGENRQNKTNFDFLPKLWFVLAWISPMQWQWSHRMNDRSRRMDFADHRWHKSDQKWSACLGRAWWTCKLSDDPGSTRTRALGGQERLPRNPRQRRRSIGSASCLQNHPHLLIKHLQMKY